MLKLALSLGVFTSSALVVTSLVGSPHGTQDSIRPSAANAADDTVEVRVAYPYGALFTDVHEQISEQFEQENPGIDIILEAPLANYEELAQRTLVGITQNNAPTLSFQGINQVRQFVDAGHTNDLSEFASSDPNWGEAGGYYPSMMELGEFNGRQHAIPFAVSTPIMYYNADLFRAAGLDPENPPTEWPDVIAAAQAIDALGDDTEGLWYNYLITGNWNYQALVYSEGGSMMTEDESAVAFSGDPGVRAAQLIRSFVDKAGMPDWSADQGEQSFVSGSVGIYFTSTSNLALLQNGAQFELRTALFPLSSTGDRRLPTGGNAGIIITDDPAEAEAAYQYAMFAAGPVGNNIMVNNTGYMPMHSEAVTEEFYAANPNYQTSIEQIPYIFRWYSFPGRNNLKIIDEIKDSLQSIVSGQETPEAAIENAASSAEDLL